MVIKTADTGTFTMNYFAFGTGDRAFVILPGLSVQSVMLSAGLIAQAYDVIAKEFTVYVFDRRNELPPAYTVDTMADDTAAVFRLLGLKETVLFGASQGGMIALTLAAKHPDLVRRLMLGSSAARMTEEQMAAINTWADLAREGDGVRLSLAMGEVLYPPVLFEQYRKTLVKIGESITDKELLRFLRFAEGTAGFDATGLLPQIKCPVLSLGAADDAVLPGAAEELERLFAGRADFESYCYTGYGHAAFDTAPDYKERLLHFALQETE